MSAPVVTKTTAATTTAITITAAATAAAIHIAAWGTIFAWTRFINAQRTPAKILAVCLGNGLVGLFLAGHFHKRETSRFPCEFVQHELTTDYFAKLAELVL